MSVEKLDTGNIIEIQDIRKILIEHPDLLSMFELLVIVSNRRLNQEEPARKDIGYSSDEEIEVILDSDSDEEDIGQDLTPGSK